MPFYRYKWDRFPDVLMHADEPLVRSHSAYVAAKSGDSDAAYELVLAFLSPSKISEIETSGSHLNPILVSAHAFERDGVNAIPEVLAETLAGRLGWEVEHDVVQTNIVSHTKADGFSRLARQAEFDGHIERGRNYLLVDDFIGQGGTLANLRGWVLEQGGFCFGATVLTGKSFSAKLSVEPEQIDALQEKHGDDLRKWWQNRFGFSYGCLTSSEARYLIRTPSVDKIRNRIVEAGKI